MNEARQKGTKTRPSWRQRAGRMTFKLGRATLIGYLLVVLLFFFNQTSLVFPGRMSQGKAYAKINVVPAHAELIDLKTADSVPIKALFGQALAADGSVRPDAAQRPTIVFFYGNGAYLAGYADLLQDFQRMGANCLIPEFVGFGLSGGTPSEAGCYATAEAAYAWLDARPDVDMTKLIYIGQSLGGGTAVDLAVKHPSAGLAMLTAFTSLTDMGRNLYPFLPINWMLQHRFENREKIAQVRCPTLIAHGTDDEIVPYAMSLELKAAAGGPVTHVSVPGARHNDFLDVGQKPVMGAIQKLVDKAAK